MASPGPRGIWHRLAHHEQVMLTAVAVVIGIVVAYAALGFRIWIDAVEWIGFGTAGDALYLAVAELPWWQVVLVPTLGGLGVGLMLEYLMPGKRAQAVAHVIEANALRGGRMGLREGLVSAAVSATSLGVGASAGREGPMVHFGATLSSWLAQRLSLGQNLSRTILGCGVAAAVSASFNAPIAGVFFALEVVIGHYALSAFAPVVIASVGGTLVARAHLGEAPAFDLPWTQITSVLEFPAFFLLGFVSAAIAIVLMWSIMKADEIVERLPMPDWSKPMAGGLALGLVALLFPQILGVGYGPTDGALRGIFPLSMLVALVALKTIMTAVTLGCRFGGGVFSPSLYIGAMTGGAFGIVAAYLFPEYASSHGDYAIVGMSAVAAAVLGAPISTILIVFELTGDYTMTVAVMVATSVASLVVRQVLGTSFFHWQLERRGLNLRGGRARHLLQSLSVGDILSRECHIVAEGTSIGEIKRLLAEGPASEFVVTDEGGNLVGTFGFQEVKDVAFDPSLDSLINARDVARGGTTAVIPADTLEHALALMDLGGAEQLAVVTGPEDRRVQGVVHHKDVLRALNQALLEVQAEEHDDQAPAR